MAAESSKQKVLQEWEGVIKAIVGDTVHVELVDITAKDTQANEVAEMPITFFLRPGMIFKWRIVRNKNNEIIQELEMRRGSFYQ